METWEQPDAVRWARLILDSHRDRVGTELVDRGADPMADARSLFEADSVVLCHDGGRDPRFVYANRAACRLWRMDHADLVGMPSRLSAGADRRADRSAMLDRARTDGVLRGYSGIRRASDGTEFQIQDAVVWTVDDNGSPVGQAATFDRWVALSAEG